MLKFYVSIRPIQIDNTLFMPKEQFRYGFKGLDVDYNIIAQNRNVDGRCLCEIVIGKNSNYSEQQLLDYKAVIIEGLQAWSVHEKSLESARVLMELLAEEPCEILDGRVKVVNEK